MNEIEKFRKKVYSLLKEVINGTGIEVGGRADVDAVEKWGSTAPYADLLTQVYHDFGDDSWFFKHLSTAVNRQQISAQEIEKIVRAHDKNNKYFHFLNMNEISSNLFRTATDITKARGQDRRTVNLGKSFFHSFIGKPLLGGQIGEINYMKPQQGHYEQVQVIIQLPEGRQDFLFYDVINDSWEVTNVSRADARILGAIALKINPKSKYNLPAQHLTIKGYMEENEFESSQPGDAENHSSDNPHLLKLPSVTNIDWRFVHEGIVHNTAILVEKALNDVPKGINDFADEAGVPKDFWERLEENTVVNMVEGYFPVFANTNYLLYNRFFQAVNKTWNETEKIDNSPSNLRYRDDGGTDGG